MSHSVDTIRRGDETGAECIEKQIREQVREHPELDEVLELLRAKPDKICAQNAAKELIADAVSQQNGSCLWR